jgi:hypothetical protein
MPRKHLSPRKARAELLALKLEKTRYEIRALRRAEREAEAALALRKSTPDWVELDAQLKQLQLEAEMDAMEACLDERRPKIPILDKSFIAKLRAAYPSLAPNSPPAAREPEPHPDVICQAQLTAAEASRSANENHKPPRGEKAWKYESTLEGYRPEDDYRNYE